MRWAPVWASRAPPRADLSGRVGPDGLSSAGGRCLAAVSRRVGPGGVRAGATGWAQLSRGTLPGRGVVRRTTVSLHFPGVAAGEECAEVGRGLRGGRVELLGHHRVV